jgi:diguanylate cyclase (GGDEF)-like protein/PAS domain S-box-containing protein
MSATIVGMVLVATIAITWLSLALVHEDMKKVISTQQYAVLTEIAGAIDQKFQSRRIALRSMVEGMPKELLENPRALQAYLLRHASVRAEFFNIAVWDAKGDLVANVLEPAMIGKVNTATREHFIDTLATRRGVISKPVLSRISNIPTILITEPALNAKGEVVYVFTASINLQEPTFLLQYENLKFGNTGYLFIVSTDGLVIAHPDKKRILKQFRADGHTSPAVARALAGFEGTTEGVSSYGVSGLYAFRRLTSTNWIISAIYPQEEAFAPIKRIRWQAIGAATALATLAGMLAWWLTRLQIAPLQHLHEHIRRLEHAALYSPLPIRHRKNEIGDLSAAFDSLMRERVVAEQKLSDNERRLRDLTNNLPVMIAYIDKDRVIRFANRTFEDWLDISPAKALNMPFADVIGSVSYGLRRDHIDRALAGERVSFEIELRGRGAIRHLQTTYIPDIDSNGAVQGIYTVAADVSALKGVESQLRLLARYDTLTGLANRFQLNEKLAEAIARSHRGKRPMAVMFLDIDHFKSINDRLGHGAGDAVLKQFAERLVGSVRLTDTIARLGGDEFVILLEELHNVEEAELVAKKIVTSVRRPFTVPGEQLAVTTSLGVVFYRGDAASTTSTLMEQADKALYRAKHEGRNTYRLDNFVPQAA